ncbi:MAG: rod shape-determining protein MreD [Spirochaetia bacterium]
MRAEYVLSTLIIFAAIVIQSTILRYVSFQGITPDIALICLVFISLRKGSQVGQVNGFIGGILEDFLSLAPLGFHAFLKTTIGFLYGLLKGAVIVDPIFVPILMVSVSTFIKTIISGFLIVLLNLDITVSGLFQYGFFLELGFNAILTPFLFALLGLVPIYKKTRQEGL